jgi:hypothetical protein
LGSKPSSSASGRRLLFLVVAAQGARPPEHIENEVEGVFLLQRQAIKGEGRPPIR